MAPPTCSYTNNTESGHAEGNEAGNGENTTANQHLEVLTALAAQLVTLLTKGAKDQQERGPLIETPRGCTFEKLNRQHPLIFEGQPGAIAAENWVVTYGIRVIAQPEMGERAQAHKSRQRRRWVLIGGDCDVSHCLGMDYMMCLYEICFL